MSIPVIPRYIARLECRHKRMVGLQHVGDLIYCSECSKIDNPQGKQGHSPERKIVKRWHHLETEPAGEQEDALLVDIEEMYLESGRDYDYEVSKYWDHSNGFRRIYKYTCFIKQDFPSWMIIASDGFNNRWSAERWGRAYLRRGGPPEDHWEIQKALRERRIDLDGQLYKYKVPR